MLKDQHCFRPEGGVSDAKGQVALQTSAEFVRSCNAQAHEMVDAIAAAVANAQAGLIWLRAEPLDLGEVRRALNSIARDGKRAAEIVFRLRALINAFDFERSARLLPSSDLLHPSADAERTYV